MSVPTPPTAGRHRRDDELEELRDSIVELGTLVMTMVRRSSVAAIAEAGSITSVASIEDQSVVALSRTVDDRLQTFLARQQPVASDLRWVLADMRVTHGLVGIAQLAREVVVRSHRVYPHGVDPSLGPLLELIASQAIAELDLALEAFRTSELALARAIEDMNSVMSDFQREFIRCLIDRSDGRDVVVPIQLAFIARCFEHIAHHAVSIADQVVFGQTGQLTGEPGALLRTLPTMGDGDIVL